MKHEARNILLINLAIAAFMLIGVYTAKALALGGDWLPQMIVWFGIAASIGCGSLTPRRCCCRVRG
ncbi:MAG: hypothetical protein KC996_09975 [Phycisphaerales bacterium]|nr:hypothetical protein [Phycisphaerales bacterium]